MIRLIFFILLFALLYLLLFRKKDEVVDAEETEVVQRRRNEIKKREPIKPRGEVNITANGQAIYSFYDTSEPDTHLHQLQDLGLQGGGYTWEGLILAAVQIFHPSIESVLDFDPEADGIAIWSSDKKALDQVAKLVGRIKSDPHFLAACIKHGEEQGYLE